MGASDRRGRRALVTTGTPSATPWYRWSGEDLELTLRVQPRAPQDAFVAEPDGAFRVRIKAPPVEGQANAALRRFLADAFGVPQSRVEFRAGEQSRLKRLLIRSPRRFPVPMERPGA